MTSTVYIGAVGRSGTTMLERALATSPHVTALGEVVHLWDRGVRDDEPCSCGVAFSACPFWTAVGERAFGGWSNVDLEQLGDDRRAVDRNRYIPLLLVPRGAPRRFRAAHARLVAILATLYGAIGDVSAERADDRVGDHVVVDSSKHPSYLFVLRRVPGVDVRLLHVVRDPRGVANSWAKHVARPESGEPMEQLGPVRAVVRWTTHNLLFAAAPLLKVPTRRLAYERFVADPTELERGLDALVTPAQRGGLAIAGRTITFGDDHTVSGNPMRFTSDRVTVRPDEQWRSAMPAARRRTIGVLTTPLRQLWSRP